MSLLTLPNEILIDIAGNLPHTKDVSAFLRTNRHLFLVLAPYLHKLAVQNPPFEWAIHYGRNRFIKSLLNSNAPIPSAGHSTVSLFHRAMKRGHLSTVKLLLRHVVKYAAPKDDIIYTALEFAINIGHERFVWELLERSGSMYTSGMPGYNLLVRSVMGTNESIVRLLLESGIDMNPNPYWDIEPLLFSAAYAMQRRMIEFLLYNGASLHAIGSQGETVLHIVARESYRNPKLGLELIKLLLDRGALLNRRTYAQETPLVWATAWGVKMGSPIYSILSGGDLDDDILRASDGLYR